MVEVITGSRIPSKTTSFPPCQSESTGEYPPSFRPVGFEPSRSLAAPPRKVGGKDLLGHTGVYLHS